MWGKRIMKKRIYIIIGLIIPLVTGCATVPPIKHPEYTESNLPKVHKIDGVPYIRQGHAQCFPACLFMIFKFYGKEISLQEIDDWVRGARGTPSQVAEQFCKMKKFNTYVFYDWKGDKIKYYLAQGYPLVAWVDKKGFGMGHHVIVLSGYDDEKQVFFMRDPAINDKEISYKKFKEIRSLVEGDGRNYVLLIWPPTHETKRPHVATIDISTITNPPPGVEIIPKPQWVEGDTWVRQTEKVRFKWEVEKIEPSKMILRQGENRFYYDTDFAFTKMGLREKIVYEVNPPQKGGLSFPLWVQKKWQNEFTLKNIVKETTYKFAESFEAKDWEYVQTPAGAFKALKIEVLMENFDTGDHWTYTIWYSPEVKHYVKSSSKDLKNMNWILAEFTIK